MQFLQITNLPKPTQQMCEMALNLISSIPSSTVYDEIFAKAQKVLTRPVNMVSGDQIWEDEKFNQIMKNHYQKFFTIPIISAGIIYFVNQDTVPACLPPHNHNVRTVALNFILEPGGPNVSTVMYDHLRNIPLSEFFEFYDYSDLTKKAEVNSNNAEWYLFQSNRIHSVENILSRRVLIYLMFEPHHTVETVLANSKLEYNILA